MARTTVTIVFELDQASDCPSGSARLPDGTSRDFHGWLGLTEALNALARADGTEPVASDGLGPSGPQESPSRALDNPRARRKEA